MIPVYKKGNRSGVKVYHVAIVEVLNVARVQRQRRSLPYSWIPRAVFTVRQIGCTGIYLLMKDDENTLSCQATGSNAS